MTKDTLLCDLKADEPGMVAVRFPQAYVVRLEEAVRRTDEDNFCNKDSTSVIDSSSSNLVQGV
jgi:hypothetical protein